jgi:hypothetical protein
MRSVILKVIVIGAMTLPGAWAAEPAGQAQMIQRVIEVTDPCQRRQLLLAVSADIQESRATAQLQRDGGSTALAALAWQNHLLYVFAGLAEQWDMAAWFTQGTQLAAQTRAGDVAPEAAAVRLAAWKQEGQRLRSAPVPGGCPQQMPRAVEKLRVDLRRWIVRQARANGSAGLDEVHR